MIPSRPALLPGERILWEGAPPTGLMLRARDVLMIPFSLMWGGFALFWNVSVWVMGAPWFFRLWGLPFLLIGAYIVAGRFVVDSWLRRRMHYYVTSKRILIERRGLGAATQTLDIRHLPALSSIERPNGSGTLTFAPSPSLFGGRSFGSGMGMWHPALGGVPQFADIPNVAHVHALIERASRE